MVLCIKTVHHSVLDFCIRLFINRTDSMQVLLSAYASTLSLHDSKLHWHLNIVSEAKGGVGEIANIRAALAVRTRARKGRSANGPLHVGTSVHVALPGPAGLQVTLPRPTRTYPSLQVIDTVSVVLLSVAEEALPLEISRAGHLAAVGLETHAPTQRV